MKKFLISLLLMPSMSFSQYISKGTVDNPDTTNQPASSIFVTSTPSKNGLTKGLFIHSRQIDGIAHNTDAFTSVGETAGKILDHTNAIHGVVIANEKLNNGVPKEGAAFGAIWGEAFAPIAPPGISYMTAGSELNVYQTKIRNENNTYLRDPLKTKESDHGSTIGMLINNYQGAAAVGHRAYEPNNIGIGNYWNDFGLAILSQSQTGRSFGYQTGIYISEVAKELIHLRGGVLDQNKQSEYGIYFSGTSLSKSAIALNNNKINLGNYTGQLDNIGDFYYDQITNNIKFKDLDGDKLILKTIAGKNGDILQIKNEQPQWVSSFHRIDINGSKEAPIRKKEVEIHANSGKIKLENINLSNNTPYCIEMKNSNLTAQDVLIINFSNNKNPQDYQTQVGNIQDSIATICIYSQVNKIDSFDINFAKIGIIQ